MNIVVCCIVVLTAKNHFSESCVCLPPATTLRRVSSVPLLGSKIEPFLLAEVWVSQARSCEVGRIGPIIPLSCDGMGRGVVGDALPHPTPSSSTPEAGGRASPEVIKEKSCACPLSAAALR